MSDPIIVIHRPDEVDPVAGQPCFWVAQTEIAGVTYRARSREGALGDLARRLVEAGVPDRPMRVLRDAGSRARINLESYRSLVR